MFAVSGLRKLVRMLRKPNGHGAKLLLESSCVKHHYSPLQLIYQLGCVSDLRNTCMIQHHKTTSVLLTKKSSLFPLLDLLDSSGASLPSAPAISTSAKLTCSSNHSQHLDRKNASLCSSSWTFTHQKHPHHLLQSSQSLPN